MTPMSKCRGVSSHASVNRGTQSRVRRDDRASAGEALRNQGGIARSDLIAGAVEADNDVLQMRRFGVLTYPLTSLLSKIGVCQKGARSVLGYRGIEIATDQESPEF